MGTERTPPPEICGDPEREREQRVEAVISSDAYQQLAAHMGFAAILDRYYSRGQLREYTDAQLDAVAAFLPRIALWLDKVVLSLHNEAGPALTAADIPDFADPSSVERQIQKLDAAAGISYTNIGPDACMAIFADSTHKSLGDRFQDLPVSCSDYTAALEAVFASEKFCISGREIGRLEAQYAADVARLRSERDQTGASPGRRKLGKAPLCLVCLFAPTLFSGMTGALSSAAVRLATLVEWILVFLFWRKG